MFDEKSGKWIKIFKTCAIVAFWCWLVIGAYAAIDNWWIGDIFNIEIADGYFLGGVLLLLCGFIVGFVQLASSMLIIQFLNNVQIIREKLEN